MTSLVDETYLNYSSLFGHVTYTYRVSHKNARLRLDAYNSSLGAAIGTYRTQEVQDTINGTPRKSHYKRATLTLK